MVCNLIRMLVLMVLHVCHIGGQILSVDLFNVLVDMSDVT